MVRKEPCVFCGDTVHRLEARIRESNIARERDGKHIEAMSEVIEAHTAALEQIAKFPHAPDAYIVALEALKKHHPSQGRSLIA